MGPGAGRPERRRPRPLLRGPGRHVAHRGPRRQPAARGASARCPRGLDLRTPHGPWTGPAAGAGGAERAPSHRAHADARAFRARDGRDGGAAVERHRNHRHVRTLPRCRIGGGVLAQPARRRGVHLPLHSRGVGVHARPASGRGAVTAPGVRARPRCARGHRPVRSRVLRHVPARGAVDRPAAADVPPVRVGGAGGRGPRPRALPGRHLPLRGGERVRLRERGAAAPAVGLGGVLRAVRHRDLPEPADEGVLQAGAHRREHARVHGVLHGARGGARRVSEPAVRPVGRGARGRDAAVGAAAHRLRAPGGDDLFPGRPLPRLRCEGPGHRLRQRRGRGGAQAAGGRGPRRRPHPRRHPSHRRQQRRARQVRLHRAQRAGPGGRHHAGAAALGRDGAGHRLRGGARDGDALGDPIEVAALQRAYGLGPEHRGTIALASLKTNVGHLDTAAGLAGLIKVALSLREEELPPSLHFESPNPRIDFDAGPFFVNTRLRPWPRGKTPRRAAVSSFGVGGTNAHAVLEEAPVVRSGPTSRSHQLFVLSARSPESLEAGALALASHVLADRSPEALEAASLKLADQVLSARSPEALAAAAKQLALRVLSARSPEALEALSARFSVDVASDGRGFADAAYTQAVGRRGFEYRRVVVARDAADLAKQLRKPATPARLKDVEGARRKRVAFVFSGQGSQQVGMGRELDASVPAFRAQVDACLGLLDAPLRSRVEALLRPGPGQEAEASAALSDTRVALPALFTVQVALARLWREWGIVPHAVLGHSFGEYAAACVAGVLSLPEALRLAVARGELMHRLPPGAMLGVALPAAEVQSLLSGRLTLAAINAPDRCVVSGPVDEVERFQAVLQQRKAGAVRMPSGHAFHSADVEPLMGELARVVASLQRSEPSVRYVSSLTGALARPGELSAPDYWATQMRQPVRFTDAVGALLEEGCGVLLEVGPGQDLTPLMRACLGEDKERVKALASLRRGGATTEQSGLLQCVGELWMQGLELDWTAFYAHEQRRRVHLPTYAFLRKRCWVEPRVPEETAPASRAQPVDASAGQAPSSALPVGTDALPGPQAPLSTAARALPSVERPALPVPGGREDAPRGDVEVRIATLWRERLGVDFVGRDDNFLELGGNSLMAAQLLNQLRDTFHVQVPLAALFEAPTVAGLASRIEPLLQHAPTPEPTRELPLVPRSRTEPLPLSFVQERVWRLEQYLPGLSAYTIPFVLRLEGPADAAILERAIQEVVQRHEALRTTYDAVDGRPVQRFHPFVRIPLPVVEVEGSPEEREEAALRIAREDAAHPFDLVHGPVLRTTLVRLRADLHLLVCAIHHIVCDTLSSALFLQEVGQLYAAFLQGRPSPLAPLPVQYADFGAWQRQSLAEARFPEQEQWWHQRLAGMPRQLGVPTDRPRPANCPLTSERMVLDFPPALTEALVSFGRSEGFTSYMTVLAAWNALLHRYTGQTDLIVGTPIGNRTRPELLPLIGYVAHSAAFRTHVGDDPSFRELLHRVRREVTDVQSRPDVPFELLVEQLVPGRDVGRERMTDTVFVYHSNLEMGGDALAAVGARGTFIEVPGTPVQWGATLSDLTLILTEEPGRVHGALEYATELFDASTARRMLEHLQVLLGAALARPEEPLSRLPLATDADRRAWPVPPPVTQAPVLPARLREHALRQPDAIAVEQAGRTWTWRELASRARRLAVPLREQGLQPGEPVALCLRASPEKLAALWGVLEAGGAPVALGPTDLDSLAVYAMEGGVVPRLVTWRGSSPPRAWSPRVSCTSRSCWGTRRP
ncbi:condensation domain-containing protein [Corallococcus sp. 4LFB]|uniref:condensation domain-containing protein n=1 Tax=Corallococcus sp. 4LFB TaxID=3383249 RepID=UPI003975774B